MAITRTTGTFHTVLTKARTVVGGLGVLADASVRVSHLPPEQPPTSMVSTEVINVCLGPDWTTDEGLHTGEDGTDPQLILTGELYVVYWYRVTQDQPGYEDFASTQTGGPAASLSSLLDGLADDTNNANLVVLGADSPLMEPLSSRGVMRLSADPWFGWITRWHCRFTLTRA